MHKSTRNPIALLLLICAAVLAAANVLPAEAQPMSLHIPPFSADNVRTVGTRTTTGKVYATPTAMRIENDQNGRKSIFIVRFDRKAMWTLLPDRKMYMELPWGSQAEWASMLEGVKVQRDPLGSEQLGPYHCDKTRVRVTYQGSVITTIQWAAKELNGFVVKKQEEKEQWSTEYRNVKLGPQDPSLFELPAGYQKMSLGGTR